MKIVVHKKPYQSYVLVVFLLIGATNVYFLTGN